MAHITHFIAVLPLAITILFVSGGHKGHRQQETATVVGLHRQGF